MPSRAASTVKMGFWIALGFWIFFFIMGIFMIFVVRSFKK